MKPLRHKDDTGSLSMAMLVVMIGVLIVSLLVPVVAGRIHAASWATSRAREVSAAEAGIEVGAGQVRSAISSSTGAGQVSKLPCAPSSAPLTGTVAGDPGLTYRTTIAYYTQNPLGQSTDWLGASTGATDTVHMGMLCSSGSGTYFPPTREVVPSYVMVTSTGKDGRATRTLRATYFVQTSNANVAGGTIYVFPTTTTNFCLDAGNPQPVVGTAITIQPCQKPVVQQQAWAYNADLSITLVSTVTGANPNGLCVTSNGQGAQLTLTQCAEVPDAPAKQQWSVDSSSHLQGSQASPKPPGLNGLCIQVSSQNAGIKPILATCAGGVTDTKQTWVPSPDVGAGMAGPDHDQVVNFQQFGRCLDDTDWDPAKAFLIAYTCKQNPDPTQVGWNEQFSYSATTKLWTMIDSANGARYCLKSPLQRYTGPTSGAYYVTLASCPTGAVPAALQWTQYPGTDSDGNSLPPLQKFTVQDYNGNCLSLTTGTADVYNGQYSKVIVAQCDGTTLQKWNAIPDTRDPLLGDLRELAQP